jgi:ribosomal protein S18 acetylase RimI-like enzyme
MTLAAPAIKTATTTDEERVIGTVVLAFVADPITRWVYPDARQYLTAFPEVIKAFGGRAFEHGTAHYAEGYAGAALWLPPGVSIDEEGMGEVLQSTVPERDQEAVIGVLEQMGSYHPAEPHWYLPLIGVEPRWQGKGLGSALLQHALATADRDGKLAYLESSNPANIPLYQKHGFEVTGEIQSGTSPTIWPMVRTPRAR